MAPKTRAPTQLTAGAVEAPLDHLGRALSEVKARREQQWLGVVGGRQAQQRGPVWRHLQAHAVCRAPQISARPELYRVIPARRPSDFGPPEGKIALLAGCVEEPEEGTAAPQPPGRAEH